MAYYICIYKVIPVEIRTPAHGNMIGRSMTAIALRYSSVTFNSLRSYFRNEIRRAFLNSNFNIISTFLKTA